MKVIRTSKINGYFITADWGPRLETPHGLAKRFFRMIDAFGEIDPILSLWSCDRKDLQTLRGHFAKIIEKKIQRDDFGVVTPNAGYWFGAITEGQPRDKNFALRCHAGSSLERVSENDVAFRESTMVQPRAEIHSYRIFRAALQAIVDAWDPVTVEANCHWFVQRERYDVSFRPAWMRYLCPALARRATPPTSAIVENLPDGGLLLLATNETFDVDNPQHVAAAEDIAVALAPLDRSLKSSKS